MSGLNDSANQELLDASYVSDGSAIDSQKISYTLAFRMVFDIKNTHFSYGEITMQLLLCSFLPYVLVTTAVMVPVEASKHEGKLEPIIALAILAPFVMDAVKAILNLTDMMKWNFETYFLADLCLSVIALSWALIFYYQGLGESLNSLWYNAAVTFPAIGLKVFYDYVVAPFIQHIQSQYAQRGHFNANLSLILAGIRDHENQWYNHVALHALRAVLLPSAVFAGGAFFAGIGADKGLDYLFASITSNPGKFGSALILNEIIGGSGLKWSAWFREAHVNYITRFAEFYAFGYLLQAANILPKENQLLLSLFVNSELAFVGDLLLNGIPVRDDKPVARIVDEFVWEKAHKVTSLMSENCLWFEARNRADSKQSLLAPEVGDEEGQEESKSWFSACCSKH